VGRRAAVGVRTTCLAAHAVPPEYTGRADAYVDLVVNELLPALHAQGLVDAVDAYCETIGFTPAQTRRVFGAARSLGLPVKLHADQLSDGGGAALAAACGALSADHLEYTGPAAVAAMAAAGTVAVLLPGAYYSLRQSQPPPVAALRRHHVPMAVATDCNPGTSPFASLRWAMQMACTLFGLMPREALAGVTCHAARALGLTDRGTLTVGARADLAAWRIDHPRDLVVFQGDAPLAGRWLGGQPVGIPAAWP
jgi:imidazolonepropionase